MKFLQLIMLVLLFLLPISAASAGLGDKWWTPEHISFYVDVVWGHVYANTEDMYWVTNQYASEEESRGKSLSYVHEHRTDYWYLEGDGYYSTNLPPPITYTNSPWWEEQIDGYEEVEVIAQEPELIQVNTMYAVYVGFEAYFEGNNYMAFEGELAEDRWYYPDYPIDYYEYGITWFYQTIEACPCLFVWNGSEYVYESLLDIHAESDVTLQHQIGQPLIKDGWCYKLLLKELDDFTSHIDQVRLYAVDLYGEAGMCPLISAIHSEHGLVTSLLRFDDDVRVDLASGKTVELKFTCFGDDIDYFIFEINGYNKKIEP